jgi:hypothetical protein
MRCFESSIGQIPDSIVVVDLWVGRDSPRAAKQLIPSRPYLHKQQPQELLDADEAAKSAEQIAKYGFEYIDADATAIILKVVCSLDTHESALMPCAVGDHLRERLAGVLRRSLSSAHCHFVPQVLRALAVDLRTHGRR